MKLDQQHIAAILSEISSILEIKGENPFKVRAYENAARVVDGLSNLEELIASDKLIEIKGIGKNLAEHIKELAETGRLREYEKMLAGVPPGILEMLTIPGVGPKKVKVFWETLGVTTLGELEYACTENRLVDLPGFGAKTQDKILQGILYLKRHQDHHLFSFAADAAQAMQGDLKKLAEVDHVEIAGSIRRRREIIKDIDLLVSSNKPTKVMDVFTKHRLVERIESKGKTKSSVHLLVGINADLRVISEKEFPFALQYFTGSKEHNVQLRNRAKSMGYKLNEYGLFKGERLVVCKSEEDIYAKLGLAYIPPELRENTGEIEAAEKGSLPKLVAEDDLVGLFHVHSTYSDGVCTIKEMALAAKKKGYKYIGISDHSQAAAYAGGLKPADVRRQHKEIDALNAEISGIRILKGIEADILPDGNVDFDEKTLKSFDFVIASVHSKFNMTEEEMTARICKALSNPYVKVLGHPTGRLLLAREAYPVNMTEVIRCAVKHNVAIELNANPHRLDIDWRQLKFAIEKGAKIMIGPDAHNVDGLDDIQYGIGIARKGWCEKKDVINCMTADAVLKLFKK